MSTSKKSLKGRLLCGLTTAALVAASALPTGMLGASAADTVDGLDVVPGTFAGSRWDLGNALGNGGSFHLFAFDTITVDQHVCGNVAAKKLILKDSLLVPSPSEEVAELINVVGNSVENPGNVSSWGMNRMRNLVYPEDYAVFSNEWGTKLEATDGIVDFSKGNPSLFNDSQERVTGLGTNLNPMNSYLYHYSENFLDFDEQKEYYVSLSAALAELDPTTTLVPRRGTELGSGNGGTIKLEPAGQNVVNVSIDDIKQDFFDFNITGINFSNYTYYDNQSLIVNIDLKGASKFSFSPQSTPSYSTIEGGTEEKDVLSNSEKMALKGTNIIYNFYNGAAGGYDLTIGKDSGGLIGHILAPGANVTARNMNGTIIADNIYVSNETHMAFFPKDVKIDLDQPAPTKAKVTIDKCDITGDEELAGAILTITGKTTGGKDFSESWESKIGRKWIASLEDGTYTLTESGTNIKDAEGNEYKIVESKLTFEVKNGKVTNVKGVTTENEDGYYDVDGNVITVCDAMKAEEPVKTAKVTINKTDITGEEELAGATLTITGTTKSGKDFSDSWVSNIGKTWEPKLEDGSYTLKETGDTVIDADGNEYEIIETELTFDVVDGKVTNVSGKTTKDDDGYYDVNGNVITVCDAKKAEEPAEAAKVVINKTDITGEEELAGATLTITGKTDDGEDFSESWTSKIGEAWSVELEDGSYTLKETGTTVKDADGNEYEVIETELTFDVVDGKVTNVSGKTTKDDDGYYDVNGNVITVCDAKKAEEPVKTAKVTINKTDITGEEELAGATLTITGTTKSGADFSESWTSKIGEAWSVKLEDGSYTLKETGTTVTDAAGNEYEVIESELKFDVVDGKVTNVKGVTTKDDNGYYDVDGDVITVCDAKKADPSQGQGGQNTENPDDNNSGLEPNPGKDPTGGTANEGDDSEKPNNSDTADNNNNTDDDGSSDGNTSDNGSSNGDDSDSDSSKSDSSKKENTKSNTSSQATATGNNTANPTTGSRVLINATEFAAAVGLCFLAMRRRKDEDR